MELLSSTKKTAKSYIEDLTSEELILLTNLLSSKTSSSDSRLPSQPKPLPPSLLHPKPLFHRLTSHLHPSSHPPANLCSKHTPLNPHLIHRLFLQISAECTIRLSRLTQSPEARKFPAPEGIREWLARIQSINSLWMREEIFKRAFPEISFSYRGIPKYEDANPNRNDSKHGFECEACLLARVGGSRRILSDLRVAMLGRKKKGAICKPVLWRVIEAWIAGMEEEEEGMRRESERVGREVRRYRRVLQLMNRGIEIPERYRKIFGGGGSRGEENVMEEGKKEEEEEEYAFEHEIIEYYRNLISTSTLALSLHTPISNPYCLVTNDNNIPNKPEIIIHPCFRTSVFFNPVTGTFDHRLSSHPSSLSPPPPPPRPNQDQTSSPPPQNPKQNIYPNPGSAATITTFHSSNANSTEKLDHTARKRATSYRKLVGMSSVSALGITVENSLTFEGGWKGATDILGCEKGGGVCWDDSIWGGSGEGDDEDDRGDSGDDDDFEMMRERGSGRSRSTMWSDFHRRV